MEQEEGRYQLGHRVKQVFQPLPGYKPYKEKNVWVSVKPTHVFDHETEEATSIDGMIYLEQDMPLKLQGPRYDTLEEVKKANPDISIQ